MLIIPTSTSVETRWPIRRAKIATEKRSNRHGGGKSCDKRAQIPRVSEFLQQRDMLTLGTYVLNSKVHFGAPLSHSYWNAPNLATHCIMHTRENTKLRTWNPSQMDHPPSTGYKCSRSTASPNVLQAVSSFGAINS